MLIQTGISPVQQLHQQTVPSQGQWYTLPKKGTSVPASVSDFTETLFRAQAITETARQNHLSGSAGLADIQALRVSLGVAADASIINTHGGLDPRKVAELFG